MQVCLFVWNYSTGAAGTFCGLSLVAVAAKMLLNARKSTIAGSHLILMIPFRSGLRNPFKAPRVMGDLGSDADGHKAKRKALSRFNKFKCSSST